MHNWHGRLNGVSIDDRLILASAPTSDSIFPQCRWFSTMASGKDGFVQQQEHDTVNMCRCGLETCGVALSEFLRIPIHVLQTPPWWLSETLAVDLRAMFPLTIEHWSYFRGAFPGAYASEARTRTRTRTRICKKESTHGQTEQATVKHRELSEASNPFGRDWTRPRSESES